MKKILIPFVAVISAGALFSCGPSAAEKAQQDSVRVADSLRKVDSIRVADSIKAAEAAKAAAAAKEKEAEMAKQAAQKASISGPITSIDGYRAYNYGRSYVTRFNTGDTGEYREVQILNEGGWTNIRSGASGSSAIAAKVRDGSWLLIDTEQYGAWYRVSDFNFRPLGYVHSSKLVR